MEGSKCDDQERIFSEIEEKLLTIGDGNDKALAKIFGTNLTKHIEGVDLSIKTGRGLTINDSSFGRKLYENINTMMEFGGKIFKEVIEANYPLQSFSKKRR